MRQLVSVPSFSCQTTCFGLFMLMIQIGTTPVLFVLNTLSLVYKATYLTAAIVSIVSVLSGVLGLCRSTPSAIISLIIAICVTFAFTLLGGLCVIATFDVHSSVAIFLNKSLAPVSIDYNHKVLRETKLYLIIASAVLIASSVLHLIYARYLYHLVGDQRGSIAYLQTFSLITFPFSLFLIIGGQYIVDTGTLVSAPYTGIIVFVCGLLLLTIAALAFIGATFEYRRLLSMCVLLSFATGTTFIGLSIAYFAIEKQIQDNILENWETVRVILPPTFQARYDKDQFVNLIRTNLKIVAYIGIVCGLFVYQEATICTTLMQQTTQFKRQMAQDKQSIRKLETLETNDESESSMTVSKPLTGIDTQALQRHRWNEFFASSKRRQRIAMRICSFLFVLAIALVFGVMCTNVVFAAKCNSIGKLVQSTNFTLFERGNATNASAVHIDNEFTRGLVQIRSAVDNFGQVQLEQYGNAERSKIRDNGYELKQMGNTLSVSVRPVDVTKFLWVDGSCQRSVMHVNLPTSGLPQLSVTSNASVDIRGDSTGGPMRLRGLNVMTDQANINVSQLMAAEQGLTLLSSSGEIDLANINVNGKGYSNVDTNTRVYSALGSIVMTNASFMDCDVSVEVGAGTIDMSSVTGVATMGRSRVSVKSDSGAIYTSSVQANWVDLASLDGDIFGVSIRTEGSSAFMGRMEVTSEAGDVTLQQVDPRGSVHIETLSGAIKLQLKTQGFAGLYYVRSDSGNITIRKGFYGTDVLTELTDTRAGQEKRGSINCDPSKGSCLSYGDLHLSSRTGNIELVIGCDSFQC